MKDILEGWESKESSDELLGPKLEKALNSAAEAIEEGRNNISGLSDQGDIDWRTARKRAKELEEKGFIDIKDIGDSSSETNIELTDKGKKQLGSKQDKDLENEVKEFHNWFLRFPTRDEIKNVYGSVTDEELAGLGLNYFEPNKEIIKETDIKLWMILLSEIRRELNYHYDFDRLIPQNIYFDDLKDRDDFARINRQRELDQVENFPREKLVQAFDTEKVFIKEKSQTSLVDEDAEMTYSIIEAELPEPYKSYFSAKIGQKHLTYVSEIEADPVPLSFWEKIKFVVKSEIPFLDSPIKRTY